MATITGSPVTGLQGTGSPVTAPGGARADDTQRVSDLAQPLVEKLGQASDELPKTAPKIAEPFEEAPIDLNGESSPKAPKSYRKTVFTVILVAAAIIVFIGGLLLLSTLLPHAGALTPAFKALAAFTSKAALALNMSSLTFATLIVSTGIAVGVVGATGLIHTHVTRRQASEYLNPQNPGIPTSQEGTPEAPPV